MAFIDGDPQMLGTWCPVCDPYTDCAQHWHTWKDEFPAGRGSVIDLRLPQDADAWEYARTFMAGTGERRTRSSP